MVDVVEDIKSFVVPTGFTFAFALVGRIPGIWTGSSSKSDTVAASDDSLFSLIAISLLEKKKKKKKKKRTERK